MAEAVVDVFREGVAISPKAGKALAVGVIEALDAFLIAVVAYIIGVGLYALFVDDTLFRARGYFPIFRSKASDRTHSRRRNRRAASGVAFQAMTIVPGRKASSIQPLFPPSTMRRTSWRHHQCR